MTFGADGTTHRNINYDARHVHYKVKSSTDEDGTSQQKTRLLGVQSTFDGSSEQSVKDWKDLLSNIASIYNQSPLAKRSGHLLRTLEIFMKLRGMHTDHCAKEKKAVRLLGEEKLQATYQSLGEDEILEKTNQELLPEFMLAKERMIKAAGGKLKWDKLSQTAQAEHEAAMLEKLVISLGKASFDMLSNDEKHILKLFIWAGCGCHKDLNTVRGGNIAMMAWWEENNVSPPVLLANRDNAAVLKENIASLDQMNAVQERAVKMTSRGGIKTTQLAGEILNNKNDKKGHHDTFRWWWLENVKTPFTFPDTSNTRFQSHCEGAGVLMQHLPHFINFLKYIQVKKNVMRFSHMEENLWKALHCTATKTELCVLALYAQAVSHPYLKYLRGSGENMLDLGPFHLKVHNHINRIIEDPTFLLGPAVTCEAGTVDGQQWNSPAVIEAVHKYDPELPHLSPVLVAFFKGAAGTWKHFISEFAPGGLIDEATTAEKDSAWMPPTNDVNEGALGSFRVLIRRQPQLTQLQYNAQAMFHRNETQAFMDQNFQTEDYQFIRKQARQAESEHGEFARKQALIQHTQAKNDRRMARIEERKTKAAEKAERVAAVKLIFDKEEVKKLKGDRLKDHLLAYQRAGAPIAKGITVRTAVAQIREALHAAIDSFNNGEWNLNVSSSEESASGDTDSDEILDLQAEESDWEDLDE